MSHATFAQADSAGFPIFMIRRILFLLPAVLALASCGKSPTASNPEASGIQDAPVQIETTGPIDPIAVPTAQRGGTLTTWYGPYPKSLNSWLDANEFSVTISGLMFESLLTMDSTTNEPIGILASSWEISPDKKTYTFHIDPRAKWSDGQPVTAEDVQFYYDVIMNPKNLTSVYRVDLSRFSRPEVIDEHTIRITAQQPHWANFWTAGGMAAFPKHAWKDVDFNKQNFAFPVVSGPYKLGEVKTNRSVQLVRRGDWWGRAKRYNIGKYNFDYLVFKAMEDRDKVLELLKAGEIDLFPIYTAQIWIQKTNFPQVQKNWIIRQEIYNKEPIGFQGFALNLRRPLFQDPRVRQALALLLDRQLMNDKLMFNQYFLQNSYYPDLYPNNENPAAPALKFDADKARALLAEAGWTPGPDGILQKNGQPFSFTILDFDTTELRHLNIYLQALKSVGINANIEMISLSTFTKRLDMHDFDVCPMNWGASRLRDPEPIWSSKTADQTASFNIPGVKDAEIDRLIELQKTEMDSTKRDDILRQIDTKLVAIQPYILMWNKDKHDLLYWNKFGTPKYVLDKYDKEDSALVYWWYDPAKAAALAQAEKTNTALPPAPSKVVYSGE